MLLKFSYGSENELIIKTTYRNSVNTLLQVCYYVDNDCLNQPGYCHIDTRISVCDRNLICI